MGDSTQSVTQVAGSGTAAKRTKWAIVAWQNLQTSNACEPPPAAELRSSTATLFLADTVEIRGGGAKQDLHCQLIATWNDGRGCFEWGVVKDQTLTALHLVMWARSCSEQFRHHLLPSEERHLPHLPDRSAAHWNQRLMQQMIRGRCLLCSQ